MLTSRWLISDHSQIKLLVIQALIFVCETNMLKIKLLPVAISSTDSTFTVPCCSTMTMKFIELGNVGVDAHAFSFDKLCVGKFLLNANVFHWCHMGHGRDKKASKTCSTSEL